MSALRHFLVRHKERFRFLKPLWVGYRVALGRLPWRWVPGSSRTFGPPRGWHPTTREYLRRAGAPDDAVREAVPAENVTRVPPRSLAPEPDWPYRAALREEIPAVEAYALHDVRFWGDYAGTLIGRDDRVLGDLTRDPWEVRRHRIFTRWKLPRVRRFDGVTAILSVAQAETNYWHWTLEVLPRIEQLRRAGFPPEKIDRFVVNHRDRPFQRETLEDLGVPWGKVVRADAALQAACACAVVPALKPGHTAVGTVSLAFLRGRAAALAPDARPHRRLYVTRRSAVFRRVGPEAEVAARLARRGFEVVECERLTVAEQRRLFREAAVVVGAHGAGLSNLVYCQPGARVLELLAPRYVDLSYWCFTGQLGLDHWILVGDGERPPEGVAPLARQDDIVFDPTRLERTLDAMGVGPDGCP
jgi:hypothetical protein